MTSPDGPSAVLPNGDPHHASPNPASPVPSTPVAPPLWLAVVLTAMAGGLGWGIRGQYGHETGAMIAGLLVSLVLVFLFCPYGTSLAAARAVALATIAISLGGSMTYGQTVGLTHDPALVGNWAALRWGLLGLALKGAIWIGFAGAFLGMALGGHTYRPRDWALLLAAMMALYLAGLWLLNEPYDPANRVLPRLYFSADWHWQPGADLKPRRERWGGLLFALIGVILYARWLRRDRLAGRLALWALVGGGLGFSLGQCVQAFHAWNLELFRTGWAARLDPVINWWNFMETTFGTVFGATLGLGLWLNRSRIVLPREALPVVLKPATEWALLAVQIALLLSWEFLSPPFEALLDTAIPVAVIPVLAVAAGRWWPYLLALPVTALPIAAKTLRQLCYAEHVLPPAVGWVVYLGLPLTLTLAAAAWLTRDAHRPDSARRFTRWGLLGCTWLYFGLNFAFFRFPWPWEPWTARTPNALVYTACACGLTWAALRFDRTRPRDASAGPPASQARQSPSTSA